MSKLYLYAVFHGNLNYSSIPPESYHEIIDNCYWPILDTVNEFNFKTGIEFPIATLDKIQKIDPLFINELKKSIKNKKCEIICSGQEQVVFPLVPEDVNKINLRLAHDEIAKRFGINCKTAYINEQLFSLGLIPLYYDEDFKNIITVWEWTEKISSNNQEKFYPRKISFKNKHLNVIWNSYVAYQTFQKYIDGKIDKRDYLQYIIQHKKKQDSCFPFYGSDMEIFHYKNPVLRLSGDGKELQRFHQILSEIERNSDLEFVLPNQIIKKFIPSKKIILHSAKFAISEKKPNTTITRWATCGRDNSKTNSICYQLLKKIRILNSFDKNSKKNNLQISKLIDCWASDYRTHTIESKYHHFHNLVQSLQSNLDKQLLQKKQIISKNIKTHELVIFNPNDYDWQGIPYELKLHFQPDTIFESFGIFINNDEIPSQIEDTKFYKNKSLRSATLVFEPIVKKKSKIAITIKSKKLRSVSKKKSLTNFATSNVKISFLEKKGGAISELIFPKIETKPFIRFFNFNEFSKKFPSEFFSGQIIVVDRNGKKFTDLKNTEIYFEEALTPIRSKLFCNLELPFGHLTKIFYAYENHPRLDIKYIFNFNEFRPAIFRVGILTLNPDVFNKNSLSYSTNNGGKLEYFKLGNQSITQDKSIIHGLSSQGCLGSTEGIMDVGDDKKGLSVFTDKSLWYSVSMINYHPIGKRFFYRISNSVSELDDTTMTWWKGRKEISFTLLGRKRNLQQIENTSQMLFLGLICVSKNKNINVC